MLVHSVNDLRHQEGFCSCGACGLGEEESDPERLRAWGLRFKLPWIETANAYSNDFTYAMDTSWDESLHT